MTDKAPDVSIDEALRLFLSIAYPQGLPEGADEEQLMNLLRDKVALDRPEWGRASGHAPEEESPWLNRSRAADADAGEDGTPTSADTPVVLPEVKAGESEPVPTDAVAPEPAAEAVVLEDVTSGETVASEQNEGEQNTSSGSTAQAVSPREEPTAKRNSVANAPDYARIKQEIIDRANQEEVPTDPEERYFYYRARELQEAVDLKKAEAHEARVKDELRRKFIEENSGKRVSETTIEKAFRIRQVLEGKFRESLDERLVPESESKARESKSLRPEIVRPTPAKQKLKNSYTETPEVPGNPALRTEPREQTVWTGGGESLAIADETRSSDTGELTADDKLASFREWNEKRKGNLKKREDLLQSRRPASRTLDLDMEKRERRPEPISLETNSRGRGTALQEIRARMSAREKKEESSDMSMEMGTGRGANRKRESMSLDDAPRGLV